MDLLEARQPVKRVAAQANLQVKRSGRSQSRSPPGSYCILEVNPQGKTKSPPKEGFFIAGIYGQPYQFIELVDIIAAVK